MDFAYEEPIFLVPLGPSYPSVPVTSDLDVSAIAKEKYLHVTILKLSFYLPNIAQNRCVHYML